MTDDLDGGTGSTGRPGPASLGGLSGFGGQDSPARTVSARTVPARLGAACTHAASTGAVSMRPALASAAPRNAAGTGAAWTVPTRPARAGAGSCGRPVPRPVPGPAFAADAIQSGRFDEDDDEHYIPPPPPPLPALDPVAKGAWTALFGGPAFLLVTTTAGWSMPGWATFGAVAAFIGGFAVIVARMGDRPPRDPGSDDGAVI